MISSSKSESFWVRPTPTSLLVPLQGTRDWLTWSQTGPTIRRPWTYTSIRSSERWRHQEAGRWYYVSDAAYAAQSTSGKAVTNHIGRIMESDLGEQLIGEARCRHCKDGDRECWVYSARAFNQVKYLTPACARCRQMPRNGGCSFSTRRRAVKRDGPHTPARLAPKTDAVTISLE